VSAIGRQVFKLIVDGEAFVADLDGSDRSLRLFWRFWKLQYFCLAILDLAALL